VGGDQAGFRLGFADRFGLATVTINREISAASPQVSQTAAYAHSGGMTVPAMVARVSTAANPAPAMLPPMARTVMPSPTESRSMPCWLSR
jgi:hypothetical protein